MKGMLSTLLLTAIAMVLVAVDVSGQSLLDNPDYKKAQELQAKADQALKDGDYDQAYAYAGQAKQHAQKSQGYVDTMLARYKASNWINLAKQRLIDAKEIGAESRYPDDWQQAAENYAQAQISFQDEKYQDSIEYSKSVLAWLQNVRPAEPEPRPAVAEPEEQPVFPQYYVVRLIPEDRDCFNKIAGYPFVYNDRYKWRILYEANKDKIRYPDNPHLIHPGQVFIIPSIKGELREGTYDPNREYPTLE